MFILGFISGALAVIIFVFTGSSFFSWLTKNRDRKAGFLAESILSIDDLPELK